MLLTWCYGLTHNFSLPRATGCLHSSDREKTVSRNARKRYVSERACFYIPKGEKPRNFMGLEAKSYSTINSTAIYCLPYREQCCYHRGGRCGQGGCLGVLGSACQKGLDRGRESAEGLRDPGILSS